MIICLSNSKLTSVLHILCQVHCIRSLIYSPLLLCRKGRLLSPFTDEETEGQSGKIIWLVFQNKEVLKAEREHPKSHFQNLTHIKKAQRPLQALQLLALYK